MEKNLYEILNIEERLLPYFLNIESSEDISQKCNEIIEIAYKKQIKKLEEEYQLDLNAAKEEKDLKIGAKKIALRRKYTPEKVKEKNKIGIDKDLEKYRIKCAQITKEYQIELRKLDLAFETLKSEKSRKNYNINMNEVERVSAEYMAQIAKEIDERARSKKVEETYSKVNQYDTELIGEIKGGKAKGERLVVLKTSKNPVEILLKDERNIKIKQTGILLFANVMGSESFVNEYQIKRFLNGEFKVDTVYTTLDLPKLDLDKKTGKPYNKEYYDCVINELLSEEAIEGSKYNRGYIGLVEREGDSYTTTLKRSKLNDVEKENLAAVMILGERNIKANERTEQKKSRKGEGR